MLHLSLKANGKSYQRCYERQRAHRPAVICERAELALVGDELEQSYRKIPEHRRRQNSDRVHGQQRRIYPRPHRVFETQYIRAEHGGNRHEERIAHGEAAIEPAEAPEGYRHARA
ncbi:hypothetical protein SDC9_134873 [bioreactor metagenome]|uniref:Uncharacterized protein n=1 Tax=bioreactor metagenome TaxID=1076179 RepID=A0A645DG26_9ZZZZ